MSEQELEARIQKLEALLARCNPPGYVVEPAPRGHEKEWIWDSCENDYDGYGCEDSEEEARKAAWDHFQMAEAERERGDR